MAVPIAATDLEDALFNINLNIHSLHESAVDLKDRLVTWRESYFALLDRSLPEEAKAHQWIVPTLALEQELESIQAWFEVEWIIDLMNSTLAAIRWNGYTPSPATEAAIVAAYNTAWN